MYRKVQMQTQILQIISFHIMCIPYFDVLTLTCSSLQYFLLLSYAAMNETSFKPLHLSTTLCPTKGAVSPMLQLKDIDDMLMESVKNDIQLSQ
jgi:hypothetical protein